MKNLLFIFIFSLALLSCGKKGCDKLQEKYATQPEALKAIRNADFEVKEMQTTANSSSIKRVEYYSCDGQNGYLVVYNLSGDIQLHRDVPKDIWDNLKSAEFMRNYYNEHIKDKFQY